MQASCSAPTATPSLQPASEVDVIVVSSPQPIIPSTSTVPARVSALPDSVTPAPSSTVPITSLDTSTRNTATSRGITAHGTDADGPAPGAS